MFKIKFECFNHGFRDLLWVSPLWIIKLNGASRRILDRIEAIL